MLCGGKVEADRAGDGGGELGGEEVKIIVECEPKEMADFILNLSQPFKTKLFVPEIDVEFGKTNCC